MARSVLRLFCLVNMVFLATTSAVRAGNIDFTVNPATIHAVSHDAGVTIVLVSGEAAVLDESSGRPTSKFTLDRIPIIHRHDPQAWHNIPTDRWLAYFTKPMKSGTAIAIDCIAADLLRDSRGTLQAVYCLSMAASPRPS